MKPLETSRFALIRSYANTMPTPRANSDLMCLKATGEIGSGGGKRGKRISSLAARLRWWGLPRKMRLHLRLSSAGPRVFTYNLPKCLASHCRAAAAFSSTGRGTGAVPMG